MSTTVTNESKNDLSITNEILSSGGSATTWATAKGTWADQGSSTWASPKSVVLNESTNNLSITNESTN